MEVIVNPKHLDRDVDVIQLETAAGAAIKNFRGACGIFFDIVHNHFFLIFLTKTMLICKKLFFFSFFAGINVPRSRFLPVKTTSDLLLLMSNLYEIDNGNLTLSHLRSFPTTPLVKLGGFFNKVSHFFDVLSILFSKKQSILTLHYFLKYSILIMSERIVLK